MKKHSLLLTLSLTAALLTNTALTQTAYDAIHFSQNEFGLGSKALGMGGAFSGLADDYSAVYWNPAGLAQLSNRSFYTELSHTQFTNDALYNNSLSSDTRNFTHLGSLGYIRPVETTRGALVFAFGYNRIQDYDGHLHFSGLDSLSNGIGFNISVDDSLSVFYPFDENTFRSEDMTTKGGVHEWVFGGAVMLSPNFSLGASAALQRGNEDYRLHYYQEDQFDYYHTYPADFHSYAVTNLLQSKFTSFVLKIGGLFTLGPSLSLGGTITLPSVQSVDEVHATDDLLVFDDGYEDVSETTGQFKYRIKTPFVFDGGFALRTSWLTLSASAKFQDWSQIQFEVDREDYSDSDYRSFLDENEIIRNNYQETVEYRFGGELRPIKTVFLRAGYVFSPSPLKTDADDYHREYYTGGVGIDIDQNVRLNATLISGNWNNYSSDSYTPEGTYESLSMNKLIVGLTYLF